jgi:signal transduction histidine kinase
MIVLSVEDNGPGISLNDQDHLFERYWQIKNTVEKGTGLGLSISKGIVEAHKGTIEVESKLGEGTTFTIRLPLS